MDPPINPRADVATCANVASAASAALLQVQGKRWKVDLNSRQEASLLLSAVNLPGGVQVSCCCCQAATCVAPTAASPTNKVQDEAARPNLITGVCRLVLCCAVPCAV